jgi:hypothetical protein
MYYFANATKDTQFNIVDADYDNDWFIIIRRFLGNLLCLNFICYIYTGNIPQIAANVQYDFVVRDVSISK